MNNQPHLIAGYLCTPLVKFPIASLKPGDKVRGTTIAELGAGNRPLDMILYKKNGRDFLLMSNNSRGVMKIADRRLRLGVADHLAGGGGNGRRAVRDDREHEGRRAAGPAGRAELDRHRARGRGAQSADRSLAVNIHVLRVAALATLVACAAALQPFAPRA